MKSDNLGIIVAKMIAAGMLVAALWRHQYEYYTLMRWVVCSVAAVAAFQAANSDKTCWAWAFGIVAIAFNPLIPVHLKRDTWAVIDLAVCVLLLVSIVIAHRSAPQP